MSRYGNSFLLAYMKASIDDPYALIVIRGVAEKGIDEALEELKRVDPDAYANLSEFIVMEEE